MSAGVSPARFAESPSSALHETNPQIKPSSRRMRIFLRSKETRLCLVILAVLIVLMAIPMSVWPAATTQPDLRSRFLAPAWNGSDLRFLFGADSLGRSVFYRVLAGARLTLLISGTATLLATIVGVVLGVVAGYYRGTSDMLISRVIDIMLAFPSLLLVLALVSSFGQSTWALIVVLGISGCAAYARVIRSSTLQLSQMEFVEASRSVGATIAARLLTEEPSRDDGVVAVRLFLPFHVKSFLAALPNLQAVKGYDMMCSILRHLAAELGADVYDEQMQLLSKQLREHYRHQVIDYRPGQAVT